MYYDEEMLIRPITCKKTTLKWYFLSFKRDSNRGFCKNMLGSSIDSFLTLTSQIEEMDGFYLYSSQITQILILYIV